MNDADRESDDDNCVPESVQSLVESLCEPSVSEPMAIARRAPAPAPAP